METAVQPEKANGAAPIPSQVCECQGRGAKKRIARLVAEKYALKAEKAQLQSDLERALALIERFRAELRARKVAHVRLISRNN
jgi:hypothetical protein